MSTFRSDSWSSVWASLTWIKTEMSLGFSISWTSDEEDVLSSWGNLSQLIESQTLTFGSRDSFSGFVGESKSTNSESLWNVQKSGVVSYRSNNCKNSWVELGLSFSNWGLILTQSFGDSWDWEWVSVESGLIESLMDGGVEFWLSSSGKERVELDQSFNISVGCLCFSDASVSDSTTSD